MLRQLLTLLAVISGFTLAASPMQAAQASVVAVAAAAERSESGVQRVRRSALPLAVRALPSAPLFTTQPALAVRIPTVLIRVDRARE